MIAKTFDFDRKKTNQVRLFASNSIKKVLIDGAFDESKIAKKMHSL